MNQLWAQANFQNSCLKTSFNFTYHESVNASSDARVVSDAARAHRVVGVGQIELVGYRWNGRTWTGKFCVVVIR